MNYKMKRALMLLAMTAAMTNGSAKPENTERTIRNDCFWQTVDGETIYSQGGGIFRFEDPETKKMRYYWYGVKYYAAEEYRKDPSVTLPNAQYDCVTCYVSDDFTNWKSLGEAVSHEEIDKHAGRTWLGRLGVVKVDSVYAMFVQCGSQVLVAESANPAEPVQMGQTDKHEGHGGHDKHRRPDCFRGRGHRQRLPGLQQRQRAQPHLRGGNRTHPGRLNRTFGLHKGL